MAKIGVIGAGMSGLAAAAALADAGHAVRVFDKGRGPGGRMSTRRMPEGRRFDHGAQYFTVEDETFARCVAAWQRAGIVEAWQGKIGALAAGQRLPEATPSSPKTRYVGTPGMNSICRFIGDRLGVEYGVRLDPPTREGDGWRLNDETGADLGYFDAMVVAVPAPQCDAMLATAAPEVAAAASSARMRACWAVMASCPDRLPTDYDGLFLSGGPLSWAARDNSKPGRPPQESWVLHAGGEWSDQHVDEEPEQAGSVLIAEFLDRLGLPGSAVEAWSAHRWRYALPDPALASRSLSAEGGYLVACGDWCGGPRVEGAFLSGRSAAHQLLEHLASTNLGSGDGI